MSTGERWRLGHRPALDGVRGIAISLVVACHAFPDVFPEHGTAGVSLFFVLSGFLITSLLVDEHETTSRINLRAFYLRRAARLFPALAVFVLVILAAQQYHPIFGRPVDAIPVALYVGNWVSMDHGLSQLDHTWSLAVEEQFYLLWPLALILIVGRVSRRTLLAITLMGVVASLLVRAFLVSDGVAMVRIYHGTDTAAAMLLAGCAFALIARGGLRARPWLVAPAVAACVALGYIQGDAGTILVPVLTIVPALALLCAGLGNPRLLTARWLRLVGQRSYGLYLWHFPLLMIIGPLVGEGYGIPQLINVPLWIAGSWGMTCASWRWVERPAQRWVRSRLRNAEPVASDDAVRLDRRTVRVDADPDLIGL